MACRASMPAVRQKRPKQVYAQDLKQFALIQMNMGREVCRRLREADNRLFGAKRATPDADIGQVFRRVRNSASCFAHTPQHLYRSGHQPVAIGGRISRHRPRPFIELSRQKFQIVPWAMPCMSLSFCENRVTIAGARAADWRAISAHRPCRQSDRHDLLSSNSERSWR
jgi:hypothetical protein